MHFARIALKCLLPVLLKVAQTQAENIHFNLFVSENLGQSVLQGVLQSIDESAHTHVVFRGLTENHQTITQAIGYWHQGLEENGSPANVEINPVAFQEQQIDRVPALSLVVNDKTVLTAFGVTSTDWLKRQYQAGKRGNIGTYDTTYPISEPDLLEVLLQNLQQLNWHEFQAKAQRQVQAKVFSYLASTPDVSVATRSLTENSVRSEDGRKLRTKTRLFEANSELFNEKKTIF